MKNILLLLVIISNFKLFSQTIYPLYNELDWLQNNNIKEVLISVESDNIIYKIWQYKFNTRDSILERIYYKKNNNKSSMYFISNNYGIDYVVNIDKELGKPVIKWDKLKSKVIKYGNTDLVYNSSGRIGVKQTFIKVNDTLNYLLEETFSTYDSNNLLVEEKKVMHSQNISNNVVSERKKQYYYDNEKRLLKTISTLSNDNIEKIIYDYSYCNLIMSSKYYINDKLIQTFYYDYIIQNQKSKFKLKAK